MPLTETPAPDARTRALPDAAPDLDLCPVADDPDARPFVGTVPLLRPYWG